MNTGICHITIEDDKITLSYESIDVSNNTGWEFWGIHVGAGTYTRS